MYKGGCMCATKCEVDNIYIYIYLCLKLGWYKLDYLMRPSKGMQLAGFCMWGAAGPNDLCVPATLWHRAEIKMLWKPKIHLCCCTFPFFNIIIIFFLLSASTGQALPIFFSSLSGKVALLECNLASVHFGNKGQRAAKKYHRSAWAQDFCQFNGITKAQGGF